ncbi:MAG: tyrosine--tRNA ligase [Clostridia bacterium]|nr:tyrosine--tRNA ligase [Clostridia bacterium]MDD4686256.1 tyrosine--tRNA ligase [Clostridia bacterium]
MFDIKETLSFLMKGVTESSPLNLIEEKLNEVNKEDKFLNIKFGMDPTAPDIHLGHTVALRKIRQLQELGHTATIIIGDFTGMIGDPSGRSKTRKQLTREEVLKNAETYKKQIFKIIKPEKTIMKYNSEWYGKMLFADVLNLCSKTTVARILERDDFTKRFKNQEPISLHEFFYPLMQAYDSVVVNPDIELGGTDQIFNILMGRTIQKDYGCKQQVAVFLPLLEGIDGIEKMSKSLGNYIGIDESAYTIYEKVMKIPDDKIIKYYELVTDKHPNDINKIKQALENERVNPRDEKMQLASEIVSLYHSAEEVKKAEEKFVSIYQKKVAPNDIKAIKYSKSDLDSNQKINIIELLFTTGKYSSKGEIRRLLSGGAIKLNDNKLTEMDFTPQSEAIISIGKGTMFKLEEN